MLFRDTLFGVYVAEYTQLLLVISTRILFLPVSAVETRGSSITFTVPGVDLRDYLRSFCKGRQLAMQHLGDTSCEFAGCTDTAHFYYVHSDIAPGIAVGVVYANSGRAKQRTYCSFILSRNISARKQWYRRLECPFKSVKNSVSVSSMVTHNDITCPSLYEARRKKRLARFSASC